MRVKKVAYVSSSRLMSYSELLVLDDLHFWLSRDCSEVAEHISSDLRFSQDWVRICPVEEVWNFDDWVFHLWLEAWGFHCTWSTRSSTLRRIWESVRWVAESRWSRAVSSRLRCWLGTRRGSCQEISEVKGRHRHECTVMLDFRRSGSNWDLGNFRLLCSFQFSLGTVVVDSQVLRTLPLIDAKEGPVKVLPILESSLLPLNRWGVNWTRCLTLLKLLSRFWYDFFLFFSLLNRFGLALLQPFLHLLLPSHVIPEGFQSFSCLFLFHDAYFPSLNRFGGDLGIDLGDVQCLLHYVLN